MACIACATSNMNSLTKRSTSWLSSAWVTIAPPSPLTAPTRTSRPYALGPAPPQATRSEPTRTTATLRRRPARWRHPLGDPGGVVASPGSGRFALRGSSLRGFALRERSLERLRSGWLPCRAGRDRPAGRRSSRGHRVSLAPRPSHAHPQRHRVLSELGAVPSAALCPRRSAPERGLSRGAGPATNLCRRPISASDAHPEGVDGSETAPLRRALRQRVLRRMPRRAQRCRVSAGVSQVSARPSRYSTGAVRSSAGVRSSRQARLMET